jgi:predicted AAA+ superfamily ATPase
MEQSQENIYQTIIHANHGSKFIVEIPRRHGKTHILKRLSKHYQECMILTPCERTFQQFNHGIPFNVEAINNDTIIFIDDVDHCQVPMNIPNCRLVVMTTSKAQFGPITLAL